MPDRAGPGQRPTTRRSSVEASTLLAEVLAAAVRRYRSEQALTQQQLGDQLSWTQSRVSRLERGDLPVNVDRLTQVVVVLGIQVAVHVLPAGQAVERFDSATWDVRSAVDDESGAALHVALRLDT